MTVVASSQTVEVNYKSRAASEKELEEQFRSIEIASKGQALISEDFNYLKIYWDTLKCASTGTKFRDLLLDNYLYKHVKESMRQSNISDLVISSNVNMVNDVEVLDHLGNSDHIIIVWNLACNVYV